MAFSRVDFPQPDGPSKQTSSPRRDCQIDVLQRHHRPVRPGNTWFTLRMTMCASAMAQALQAAVASAAGAG